MRFTKFYELCKSNAKNCNPQLAIVWYLDSIARSLASLADNYDEMFDKKEEE